MRSVAAMQLSTLLRRQLEATRRVLRDAVPNILDELNALGKGQLFEVQSGIAHEESIHLTVGMAVSRTQAPDASIVQPAASKYRDLYTDAAYPAGTLSR